MTQELALGPGNTSGRQGEGCVTLENLESATKQRSVQSQAPALIGHVAGQEHSVHFLVCKSRVITIYLFWVL